jgi:cob(I)alamin adenosyltransferase
VKAYSGRGDRGNTSLYSGERVPKSHPRVEAYGDIDELNSFLGALISTLPQNKGDLKAQIEHIQSILFVAGGWLATTPDSPEFETVGSIPELETKLLEQAIDSMDHELPRLKEFLLPGGHISASFAHIARTVCRRAERHAALLAAESSEGRANIESTTLLAFLNRLSSYLFVLARYLNWLHEVDEVSWKKPGSDSTLPG